MLWKQGVSDQGVSDQTDLGQEVKCFRKSGNQFQVL